MSYMDIANIATNMQQANTNTSVQLWGVKSMMQNQSNVIQQLLGEVSQNTTASNNPPNTGNNVNIKA